MQPLRWFRIENAARPPTGRRGGVKPLKDQVDSAAQPSPAGAGNGDVAVSGFLTSQGEMAALIRAHDWSSTPLGPIETWPQSLKTATGLVVASPVPIVMLWGPQGVMIYNDAYSVFAGGRHPQLLGSNVLEGWPEVADFNANVMKVGLAGGTLAYKDQELTLHRHGRPEQVWMNLDYWPVPGEDGRPAGVIATVVETTERIAAERRQAETNERLEIALSAGRGVGTWDWDIVSDRVVADERFGQIYGVDPAMARDGAPLAKFFEAIHPDDADRVQSEITRTLGTREPFRSEYRLLQPNGNVRWVSAEGRVITDEAGKAVRFPGVSFDITERRETDAALADTETRYSALFGSITSGFCIIQMKFDADMRPVDYMIVEGNPAFEEMTGLVNANGKWVSDIAPGLEQHWFDLYGGVALTGEPVRFENPADVLGRWYDVEALRIGAPSAHRVAILFNNITERKRFEARQAALIELDDAIASIRDVGEIGFAASRILGETLQVSRVGYGVIQADSETITIGQDWTRDGAPSVAGVHHFRTYGSYVTDILAGEPAIITDVESDPRTRDAPEALLSYGIRALLDVPVTETGRVVAQMLVHASEPRSWTESEVVFVRSFAERTRAAIARREAEQTSRDTADELQRLADSLPLLVSFVDVDLRYAFANKAYADWFGVIPSELKGRLVADVVGEAAWRVMGPVVQRALAGEAFVSEQTVVYANVGQRHVRSEFVPRYDANGQVDGYYAMVQDISAQHQDKLDLIRSEAELRDSEARYRTLFGTMDEGFCIIEFIDGPHGPLSDYVHVEANAAYTENAGIPDVVGKKARDLVGAEAQDWIDLYGEVLRTGHPIRFEKELQETGRWLELAAFRVEPASRKQVAVLFKDLTEKRQAEVALRTSEAQFRAFSEAVPNHVWASRPNGELYWFNSQVYAYTGFVEGELDGPEGWAKVVHPDDLPAAADAWTKTLKTGDLYRTEFRIRRADGAWRWFVVRAEPVRDAEGVVTGWVGANIDIDDIRRQAAELEEVNGQLQVLLAGSKAERDRLWTLSEDMLARADYAGGLVAVNPAWTRTLGWSEHELLTNPYADIINADNIGATTAALVEMSETGKPTRFENLILSKDGAWTPIGWTVAPEPDGIHFIAVGRDLTEDKAREAMLAEAHEALRQSQKMEAVGQLTGGIAHDFNNLLAGISGSLELLQRRLHEGRLSGVERYIDAAQGASQRAAALTQRLLAFSRRQTLDPKPVAMNRLIGGMEDLIRRTVGPDIEVEVVGAAGLWTTRVDPSQLENALLNLCINARDAMAPNAGRLTIETANKWLDDRGARERDLVPGQYVSLCVTDTGSGIPPEIVSKIFDPFFTTKPIGQGTGLGLSMIHGFVRQSGGQVRVYSEPDKGTTMCLYLPRYTGELDALDPNDPVFEGHSGHGETILLIDDEPTVRMLAAEVLGDAGYKVIEAIDGPSGLQVLNSGARIDLLVTDVGLPGGLNGRQVADAARVQRPDLKVLFITGYAENAAVGNGLLDAGMAVLTKPFVMTDLINKVGELIDS